MATKNSIFNYTVVALAAVAISTGANAKTFISVRANLVTNAGVAKERTITVFNTKNNPNLVEQVAAALSNEGGAPLSIVFDKFDKGEVARVIGFPRPKAAAEPTAA